MNFSKSHSLFEEASQFIPGGVNSPVRSGKAVGTKPIFVTSGKGCYITDVDGNKYIDYVCSWGPLILGHANEKVIDALKETLPQGTSFGIPTPLEVEMAKKITEMVPSIEKVRMVNSGTEAVMSAIRLARGYTGRARIVKFDGCYHGHGDCLLVEAGSGVATLAIPGSPGVPENLVKDTISLPYNNLEAVKNLVKNQGNEIACIILEPVAGNMGVVPPVDGYLEGLREICSDNGILLIFDEVMTGFRVSKGGAQELYGVYPDITCLGKVIGGGMPVGAYGGSKEIMSSIAPEGNVYQAGTLSGNPLAMSAGLAQLELLSEPGIYEKLEEKSAYLEKGIMDAARKSGVEVYGNRVGSMGCVFFTGEQVKDFETAKKADTEKYAKFFRAMLEEGVYLAPSQFEAYFVSTAHEEKDLDKTIEAARKAFKKL